MSSTSFISAPFFAIIIMIFIILVIAIFPEADADMRYHADAENSRLEVHSMVMSQFHGENFESNQGDPISDYRSISYLTCGTQISNSWVDQFTGSTTIEAGALEIPTYYEFYLDTPTYCGNDPIWDTPSGQGAKGDPEKVEYFTYKIPVRGGNTAEVTMEYSFN